MKCKLCLSRSTDLLFFAKNIHGRHVLDSKDNFQVYKCDNCGVIFIADVIIDSEYYSKYYHKNYYDNELNNGMINRLVNLVGKLSVKFKERQMLSNLKSNRKFKLKILDIGCGKGEFLTNISNDKFDKYGIEINPEGYKVCKEKKLKVYNQELVHIGLPENKMDVYYLWTDQKLYKPRDKKESKEITDLARKFIVLFIGRLIKIKGVEVLIEVAKQVDKKINFVFIGDNGPLLEVVEEAASQYENIISVKDISGYQLVPYYQSADILIVPSQYEEAFGKVIDVLSRLTVNCRPYAEKYFSNKNAAVIAASYYS